MINDIKQWVEDFVSVHNIELGTVPCPFAKQAMLNDTIAYKEFKDEGTSTLRFQFYELVNDGWDDDNEVLVLYANTYEMSVEELQATVTQFNNTCSYLNKDLVALEDHPSDPEEVNGVTMNFGKCILVLVQRLSKLNKASAMLKKQGYYDNWSQENYDDVVSWRI